LQGLIVLYLYALEFQVIKHNKFAVATVHALHQTIVLAMRAIHWQIALHQYALISPHMYQVCARDMVAALHQILANAHKVTMVRIALHQCASICLETIHKFAQAMVSAQAMTLAHALQIMVVLIVQMICFAQCSRLDFRHPYLRLPKMTKLSLVLPLY